MKFMKSDQKFSDNNEKIINYGIEKYTAFRTYIYCISNQNVHEDTSCCSERVSTVRNS